MLPQTINDRFPTPPYARNNQFITLPQVTNNQFITLPQAIDKNQFNMVHSVKNCNKLSKSKSALKKRKKSLARLGARQAKEMVEIKLPFMSLGDLRERWRQKETPLDPCLSKKISRFKRIK